MNQALAIKKDSKNRNQNKASNLVVATHLNHQCEKHAQVKLDCLFSGPGENSKTCLKFHHRARDLAFFSSPRCSLSSFNISTSQSSMAGQTLVSPCSKPLRIFTCIRRLPTWASSTTGWPLVGGVMFMAALLAETRLGWSGWWLSTVAIWGNEILAVWTWIFVSYLNMAESPNVSKIRNWLNERGNLIEIYRNSGRITCAAFDFCPKILWMFQGFHRYIYWWHVFSESTSETTQIETSSILQFKKKKNGPFHRFIRNFSAQHE